LDIEIDRFCFSFDYHIVIYFEMDEIEWEKDTIMPLVENRLKEKSIDL
jgi:hypothetical protein